MYLTGIIRYLIWPAFILISLGVIIIALSFYEKKFGEGAGKNLSEDYLDT